MGFQDRDYYREGSQAIYVTSVVIKLIILNGIVFLIELLFGGLSIARPLAVHPDTIVRPLLWWQFLTAGFVHDPLRINHVVFNMLGLFFFGQRLEDRFGRWEFLRFYLVAIVLGFVVWSGSQYYLLGQMPAGQSAAAMRAMSCFGASGGVTAVILLYCLLYPRATVLAAFLFPIPAWVLGVVIVVTNLFGSPIASPVGPRIAYDVHLTGAAFAVAYWYFGWNLGRLPGVSDVHRLFTAPRRWFRSRPPLKVHDPEQYYQDLDAEADRVLAKIKSDGLDSLTAQERRILEDYSRRTRQKLR
jgi:membrane associated rhomboid family serine protease